MAYTKRIKSFFESQCLLNPFKQKHHLNPGFQLNLSSPAVDSAPSTSSTSTVTFFEDPKESICFPDIQQDMWSLFENRFMPHPGLLCSPNSDMCTTQALNVTSPASMEDCRPYNGLSHSCNT